uniref:Uncharacterized protein n=1 Tax=viral metagenome TaxID=1070528 RepID=A0A6M3JCJ0_9ZZZZ
MQEPEYISMISGFPQNYTMRAETIRNWLKAVAFVVLIAVVMYVGLVWVRP